MTGLFFQHTTGHVWSSLVVLTGENDASGKAIMKLSPERSIGEAHTALVKASFSSE